MKIYDYITKEFPPKRGGCRLILLDDGTVVIGEYIADPKNLSGNRWYVSATSNYVGRAIDDDSVQAYSEVIEWVYGGEEL